MVVVKSFKLKRLLQQCVPADDFSRELPSDYSAKRLAVERVASFQVQSAMCVWRGGYTGGRGASLARPSQSRALPLGLHYHAFPFSRRRSGGRNARCWQVRAGGPLAIAMIVLRTARMTAVRLAERCAQRAV